MTAPELVDWIRGYGGRVYRMNKPPSVFVLTTDQELARDLIGMGGKTYVGCPAMGYRRGEKREWDIWINHIPVDEDSPSIYEAAA